MWEWLGLGKGGEKTGLDLLQVLAAVSIPVVVVVMASIFTASQSRNQQQAEEDRARSQQDVEEERAQDEALQTYLEGMGSLLLEEELGSSGDAEVRTLAEARTSTVLERVNGYRKRSVVLFLHKARLIQKNQPLVSLTNADLSSVDLRDADLRDAELLAVDLSGADLSHAHLNGTNLLGANLLDADLSVANMRDADLSATVLIDAELSGALLSGANMSGANLLDADLRDADLSGADLRGARGVTNEELEEQAKSLIGTTMPDGTKHD